MSRPISHPATGRWMDIAVATPGDIAFLADLYDNLTDPHDHGLICETAGGGDEDRQVYVYKPNSTYSCRHFPGHRHHGSHHDVVPESDAHKRGKDYGLSALDRGGIQAGAEISSNRKTRSDVVGFGAVVIAAEIQATPRPSAATTAIKARDTRARRATAITTPEFARELADGIHPVWVQIHDGAADWLHQVPSVRSVVRHSEWSERMPRLGTVGAAGVRTIDPEPCRVNSRWDHCPVTRRGYCGSWHPFASVRTGLTLDDVFVQASSGLLVPLRYHVGGHLYLTDPTSVALYTELGGNGTWEPGAPAATRGYNLGLCRHRIHTAQDEQERIRPDMAAHAAPPAATNDAARTEHDRREAARTRRLEPCEACGELIDRMGIDGRIHVATCRNELPGRRRRLPAVISAIPPPARSPVRHGACRVPECEAPARLYPGGWLCDQHQPGRN